MTNPNERHPRDFKNKMVAHEKFNFVVAGGRQLSNGKWLLKSHKKEEFPLEECYLVSDIRSDILSSRKPGDGEKIIAKYGLAIASRIQQELEEEVPARVAAVIVKLNAYCWEDFQAIAAAYGVTKEASPELNKSFRFYLTELKLEKKIQDWYQQHEQNRPKQLSLID